MDKVLKQDSSERAITVSELEKKYVLEWFIILPISRCT
jgi:hypothetical protein